MWPSQWVNLAVMRYPDRTGQIDRQDGPPGGFSIAPGLARAMHRPPGGRRRVTNARRPVTEAGRAGAR